MIETAVLRLALNVFHEVRGKPETGQWAVDQITINRASHDPAKVCDTVFAPRQFSWTNRLIEAPTPARRIPSFRDPVAIGGGLRIFGGDAVRPLHLVRATAFDCGIVALEYRTVPNAAA